MSWSVGPVVVKGDEDLEDKFREHASVQAALDAVADADAKGSVEAQLDAAISAAIDLRASLADDTEAVQVTASGHVSASGEAGAWSTTVTVAAASA